ncbi:unnamed protein product, partial [Mesorhabditis belari]|uniref:Uncharacterized protein n=1 Tax=Mesorhabditis belari TaxID=2138241 RepID=A0AAF3JC45_9BILA
MVQQCTFLECEQRDRSFEADSVCHDDLCNRVPGKAIETELLKVSDPNEDPVADFTCYVGIQVGSMTLAGAVSSCSQAGATGSCASASTFLGQYQATLYFCTTHAICNAFVTPSPP